MVETGAAFFANLLTIGFASPVLGEVEVKWGEFTQVLKKRWKMERGFCPKFIQHFLGNIDRPQ